MDQNKRCPNCGACQHCGAPALPWQATPQWVGPWWGIVPPNYTFRAPIAWPVDSGTAAPLWTWGTLEVT